MRKLIVIGFVVLVTLSYGFTLQGRLTYTDYKGSEAQKINNDVMRTANYLFSKQTHEMAELNADEIAKIKSETIQSAIDRYAKYSEELGQNNDARKKFPLPDN